MPYFCGRPTQEEGSPDDVGCNNAYTTIETTSICSLTGKTGMTAAMQGTGDGTGPLVIAGLTGCSRINSLGPAGQLCQNWAEGERGGYQQYVDGLLNQFCAIYPCSQDCLCINAGGVDPTFISITESPGAPSDLLISYPCWYSPCQQTNQLVNSVQKMIYKHVQHKYVNRYKT